MPDTKKNNNKYIDLKDITLAPGIYDFTPDIKEYIKNGTPLSEEEQNVLRTFNNQYSFEEDINQRGKETILKELDDALKIFNFEQAKQAVAEGIKKAQEINPDVKIKPFPIVFLFIPRYGDAKAFEGKACGINIDALKLDPLRPYSPYEKIKAYSEHEIVHIFLHQLNLDNNKNINISPKKEILSVMWEEGLTTYMESNHYNHHKVIEEDAPFWISTINEWFQASYDKRKELFEVMKKRNSFKSFLLDTYNMDDLPDNVEVSNASLIRLIEERNGIGYHIGSYIWKKQIEKAKKEGKTLKDLVMGGSDQMEQWIKEDYTYKKEN